MDWANADPVRLSRELLAGGAVARSSGGAEPGREDIVLKIASAYEAASKRRVPPPAFGPL